MKQISRVSILCLLVMSLNGCALLQAPFTIVQQILSLAIKIVDKAPKYPGLF